MWLYRLYRSRVVGLVCRVGLRKWIVFNEKKIFERRDWFQDARGAAGCSGEVIDQFPKTRFTALSARVSIGGYTL